jgi:hypothetical protein
MGRAGEPGGRQQLGFGGDLGFGRGAGAQERRY